MRAFLTVLFVLASALSAHAQGLVQLTLDGAVDTTGGGRIEIEVRFADPQNSLEPRTLSLDLLLAEKTGAIDVAGLLAQRLERAGARVVFTGANAPMRGPTNLFVEDVYSVGLRLGHGLIGSITLCEDAPQSVRISPGVESKLAGTLSVTAQTTNLHTKERGHVTFDVALLEKATLADTNSRVLMAAIAAGWRSESKSNEWWMPGANTDKATVTHCSFDLRSNADWRIDVVLTPRTAVR